ncbi:hypothetical protein ACA30_16350 [Virgibacillus soli]|nr:hypothetical protein ACA30_16350 [Virgibacillus soli]
MYDGKYEKQHTIDGLSYQVGSVRSESVRQQVVDILVNVDKEMANIVAENIGVNRPSGDNVPVSTSYPSLSQANTPKYAYTQKVGVLIGNGFNSNEVTNVLNYLKQNGVFIEIVSEKLGTVTGADGTQIKVNKTFITTSPYLLDSLYVVGGRAKNEAKFHQDVMNFVRVAFSHYKPIGVATTAQSQFQIKASAGVVFAGNNPNFERNFISAIAQQRFWERT